MLENMQDLHLLGGGFSKVRYIWKYGGPMALEMYNCLWDKLGREYGSS
jgi:hypothetical protein